MSAQPLEPADPGIEALKIAGHDFKTPLTTLRTLAQLFQMSAEKGTLQANPERLVRNCRIMMEQVDRLVDLTEELLDVARAYGGRAKLAPASSDLREVARVAASRFQDRVVDLDLPEEPIDGFWDQPRLTQALSTMLSESEKVSIRVHPEQEFVDIELVGELGKPSNRNLPKSYIAQAVIEGHGGSLLGRGHLRFPRHGATASAPMPPR